MKNSIVTLLLLAASAGATAQSGSPALVVYDVTGKVTAVDRAKETPVEKRQTFSFSDRISIADGACIKLIDKEGRKMYTLRSKGRGKISTLIENQKQAGKNLSSQYFAYVLRSLTRNDTGRIHDTGLTTGTYRNDADSLLCDIDSLQEVVDSLQDVINTMVKDSVKKE